MPAPHHETVAVEVHYFAAAAEAATRTEERLEVPDGTTLAGVEGTTLRWSATADWRWPGSSASPATSSTPCRRRRTR